MKKQKERKSFSLSRIFASFFGALMIAGAFAYYNYKFSEYQFVDFEKMLFYGQADVFLPTNDEYTILFYSSNKDDIQKTLSKIKKNIPIILIDLYQKSRSNYKDNTIFVSSDTNTLLRFIQRFNIYETPSIFKIKKQNKYKYKQNSPIQTIN